MSKENLPERIDPYRFADQAVHLQGELSMDRMPRLQNSLGPTGPGRVVVDIKFGVDEQAIRFMRVQYSAHLTLNCQRCMKPFDYEMTGDFLSGFVPSEEAAAKLPKAYDPLIVKDDLLVIQDSIEDEILINLPIVPKHASNDCGVKMPYTVGEAPSSEGADKENPFKVIESLRSKKT